MFAPSFRERSQTVVGRRIGALARLCLTFGLLTFVAACARAPATLDTQPPAGAAAAFAALPLRSAPQAEPRAQTTPPDWRWYFDDLDEGGILVNIEQRWLIYWPPGGMTYHPFPIAVPLDQDLTRVGRTRVVRKRENPDWRPTPSMRERNPDLPAYVGPGPHNPLGEHALYLGWTYYAIHGTNDPRSIGTRATSGCFRLDPADIEWLFERVDVGTPVVVIQDLQTGRAL